MMSAPKGRRNMIPNVVAREGDYRLVEWGGLFVVEQLANNSVSVLRNMVWETVHRCSSTKTGPAVVEFRNWVALEEL